MTPSQSVARLQEALRETAAALNRETLCGCVYSARSRVWCARCHALETAYAALALPVEPSPLEKLYVDPEFMKAYRKSLAYDLDESPLPAEPPVAQEKP